MQATCKILCMFLWWITRLQLPQPHLKAAVTVTASQKHCLHPTHPPVTFDIPSPGGWLVSPLSLLCQHSVYPTCIADPVDEYCTNTQYTWKLKGLVLMSCLPSHDPFKHSLPLKTLEAETSCFNHHSNKIGAIVGFHQPPTLLLTTVPHLSHSIEIKWTLFSLFSHG